MGRIGFGKTGGAVPSSGYVVLCIVLGTSLLAFSFACIEKTDGHDPSVFTGISGVVTDSLSGNPVESARVCVDDTTYIRFYSDSLGRYKAGDFLNGDYVATWIVYCLKPGYSTKWQEVRTSPSNRDFDSVNFQLVPIVREVLP